ncbi:MAG: TRIC cation channel family protein [Bacteroidota bacterium]
MKIIYFIDLFGTFVFTISGIIARIAKKFDIFGAGISGLFSAIGFGLPKDVLIG